MRHTQPFGNEAKCLIPEVGWTITHETRHHTKISAPIDNGPCGILSRRIQERKLPAIVGVVIVQHEQILFAGIRLSNLDVFELQQIVCLCTINIGTERTRYFPLRLSKDNEWKSEQRCRCPQKECSRRNVDGEILQSLKQRDGRSGQYAY